MTRLTLGDCFEIRQVLLLAAQQPSPDGHEYKTWDEMMDDVSIKEHPRFSQDKQNAASSEDRAARRWFDEHFNRQLERAIEADMPRFYAVTHDAPTPSGPMTLLSLRAAFLSREHSEESFLWVPGMREWARAHHCMPALTSMFTRYRDSGKWTGKAKYSDVQRAKGMADIGAIVLEGCDSLIFVQPRVGAVIDEVKGTAPNGRVLYGPRPGDNTNLFEVFHSPRGDSGIGLTAPLVPALARERPTPEEADVQFEVSGDGTWRRTQAIHEKGAWKAFNEKVQRGGERGEAGGQAGGLGLSEYMHTRADAMSSQRVEIGRAVGHSGGANPDPHPAPAEQPWLPPLPLPPRPPGSPAARAPPPPRAPPPLSTPGGKRPPKLKAGPGEPAPRQTESAAASGIEGPEKEGGGGAAPPRLTGADRRERVLFYVGSEAEGAAWDPLDRGALFDERTQAAESARAVAALGYAVVVAGPMVASAEGTAADGVQYVHAEWLVLTSPPLRPGTPASPGRVPPWVDGIAPGEALFDHVVIVRLLGQFAARLPLLARVGVYLWVAEREAESLGLPAPPASADDAPSAGEGDEGRATPTPEARLSMPLLANLAGRLARLVVPSTAHKRVLEARLRPLSLPPTRGPPRSRVAVVRPLADGARWGGVRSELGDGGSPRHVRNSFLACVRHLDHPGLVAFLDALPALRESLPGASITAGTLPFDGGFTTAGGKWGLTLSKPEAVVFTRLEEAPWGRYAGLLHRRSLMEELLRADFVLLLLPAPSAGADSRPPPPQLLLEAMLAETAIVSPALGDAAPLSQILGQKEAAPRALFLVGGVAGQLLGEGTAPLAKLCSDRSARDAAVRAARRFAEAQHSPSATGRAWEAVFEDQYAALHDGSPGKPPLPVRATKLPPPSPPPARGTESCYSFGDFRRQHQLYAGLLVLGGWLAGSVWILLATWRQKGTAAPPHREREHGSSSRKHKAA